MIATKMINSKQKQRNILMKIREHCDMSNTEIALLSDVSPTLVSYVWSGVNSNKKVLSIIMDNLNKGWDDDLTAAEVAQLDKLCKKY